MVQYDRPSPAVRTSQGRKRFRAGGSRSYRRGMRSALDVYGRAVAEGGRLRWLDRSGRSAPLPLYRWTAEETPGDRGLLDRCAGPVLDVGCGPGRLAAGLLARGVAALGVDISPAAVARARARGAAVLVRSVYDRLPGEGRWRTAVLADGNVGIGGDPLRLLCRLRELLAPYGTVLVEVGAPGTSSGPEVLRLVDDLGVSEEFPWAHLAIGDVAPLAATAGLTAAETWTEAGRWFTALVHR
jgi:SAM-dependent methyltransferase